MYPAFLPLYSSICLHLCSSVSLSVFHHEPSPITYLSALLALQCHICLPTFLLTYLPEHLHEHLHENLPENLFNPVFNHLTAAHSPPCPVSYLSVSLLVYSSTSLLVHLTTCLRSRTPSRTPHHNLLSLLLSLQCHVCLPTFCMNTCLKILSTRCSTISTATHLPACPVSCLSASLLVYSSTSLLVCLTTRFPSRTLAITFCRHCLLFNVMSHLSAYFSADTPA
jgi:hypothetical protein